MPSASKLEPGKSEVAHSGGIDQPPCLLSGEVGRTASETHDDLTRDGRGVIDGRDPRSDLHQVIGGLSRSDLRGVTGRPAPTNRIPTKTDAQRRQITIDLPGRQLHSPPRPPQVCAEASTTVIVQPSYLCPEDALNPPITFQASAGRREARAKRARRWRARVSCVDY